MGRDSIQKFLDELNINSRVYFIMVFISMVLIIGILLVNYKLKQGNKINKLIGQTSELVNQ